MTKISLAQSPTRGATATGRQVARHGAVVVLAAFLMVFMLAFLVFSIDMGCKLNAQTELQRSVDAAALAGAGVLVDGTDQAQARALEYIVRNPVGTRVITDEDHIEDAIAEFLAAHEDDVEVKVGYWDASAFDEATGRLGKFIESDVRPSTISVTYQKTDNPYFFAPLFGQKVFGVQAEAIAMYQPREIALVLDLSASMNDDSELGAVDTLGEDAVVANLRQIWEELGSPTYGSMSFDPVYISSTNTNSIKQQLGLRYRQGSHWVEVPYPYPSGSWNDWIDYVKSSSNNSTVKKAGYQKKYGLLTLINYWLERHPSDSATPPLDGVSAQPITAVKDAVEVFMDYIQAVDTDDRIALAIYNAPNGEGKVELGLTDDFEAIVQKAAAAQAGHYHDYTNIAGGLKSARQELDAKGRPNAVKIVVLMTDGNANWANGGYSTSSANQNLLQEAAAAAASGYKVITISLGANADTSIMQQVADITGGTHFNVPGGQAVAAYSDALKDVFHDIARDRPLKIVR